MVQSDQVRPSPVEIYPERIDIRPEPKKVTRSQDDVSLNKTQ